MGFNAGEVLEPLDYDFSAFGGPVGTVPEPSTGDVRGYFKAMKDMAKEARKYKDIEAKLGDVDDLTDEELADRMATLDEAEEGVNELQRLQKEALAGLCSNQPSFDELDRLPHRVFQAFNTWLVGEIAPKKDRSGPQGK